MPFAEIDFDLAFYVFVISKRGLRILIRGVLFGVNSAIDDLWI